MGMVCNLIGHEWAHTCARNGLNLDTYRNCQRCSARQHLIGGGIGGPDVWEDWTPEMREWARHARRCAAGVRGGQQVARWQSWPGGIRKSGRECEHCKHFELLEPSVSLQGAPRPIQVLCTCCWKSHEPGEPCNYKITTIGIDVARRPRRSSRCGRCWDVSSSGTALRSWSRWSATRSTRSWPTSSAPWEARRDRRAERGWRSGA